MRALLMKLALSLGLTTCHPVAPEPLPPPSAASIEVIKLFGPEIDGEHLVSFDTVEGATSYVIYAMGGQPPTKTVYALRHPTPDNVEVEVIVTGESSYNWCVSSVRGGVEGELSSPAIDFP